MKINDMLLPEFDMEMANTRKTLERVPHDKLEYQPHQKSMKMGSLANHLAEIPRWGVETVNRSEPDLAPPGGPQYERKIAKSQPELLAIFDKNVADARQAIAGTSDEHLMGNWSLLMGGKTLLTCLASPSSAILF